MNGTTAILEATIRTATPLLLAANGEVIAEHAGILNIALEGCIIGGAYAAFAASTPAVGYPAAAVVGLAIGVVLALFVVGLRRDQIVVGTALTLLALGLTGALFRAAGNANPIVASMDAPRAIPLLSSLPVVGHAFFVQPIVAFVAFATTPLTWWFLRHTHAGLALRAVGEDAEAAAAAGINVTLVRWAAVVFGCGMGGIAGAALVLAQAGAFAENMSAGRGFLAIAIVALGRWRPLGVAGASLLFGSAMAIQFVVQALGWHVRYELALMIPYVLTLGALVFFGRGSAPAMLGRAIN